MAIEILRGAANFNEMNRERTSIVGTASAPYRSAMPSVASLDSCRRRVSTTFTVNFSRCSESLYRTHSYPAIAIEVTRIYVAILKACSSKAERDMTRTRCAVTELDECSYKRSTIVRPQQAANGI